MIFIPIFREITSCFRHLERPIKTKEHKIKHLFLYVFIGFPLFFRRRKQIASRRADGELKLINVFLRENLAVSDILCIFASS